MNPIVPTVHFIYVCQRLFGDNFFITSYFELKVSWCVSTFFIWPGTKFQLDPTKNEKFPHRPQLLKSPTFVTWRYKSGRFLYWGSMGKFFVFRRIKLKFCSWWYKKCWHTLWKFQLEIISNKQEGHEGPGSLTWEDLMQLRNMAFT